MIFDIIENKLEAIGLIRGRSLFRNYMPAEIVVGVMVRVPLQGIQIDPYIKNHYRGELQVVTRHKDPVQGAQMAGEVQRTLTLYGREFHPASIEHGDVNLDVFMPSTLPITFPRLSGNGHEWSQHFKCVFTMQPVDAGY
jgi:hypothetical protein